jgi:sulfur-oxidizing protein SoxY
MPVTRRRFLVLGPAGGLSLTGFFRTGPVLANDESADIVEYINGAVITDSDRLHLSIPAVFPNGSSVPLELYVDTAMTAEDHVSEIRIFAPHNPITEIAGFIFTPGLSIPRISTRIRLSQPQYVVAVAKMNDGSMLRAKQFVDVATNGCAEE